jgi:uncharacterized membrane protein
MRRSVADVLARLRAEGLAPAGNDDAAREALRGDLAEEMPWYLRAIIAFGAWIATAFLLFSLIAVAGLQDETIRAVVGVALIGAAVAIRRRTPPPSEFLRWAAVAMALAGQGLMVASVAEMSDSPTLTSVFCLVISIVLIVLVRDTALRFLATLSGAGSFIIAFVAAKLPQGFDVAVVLLVLLCGWLWRGGLTRRSDAMDEMLRPVGYGLIVVLFGALLARTLATSAHSTFSLDVNRDFRELGIIATIGATIALLVLVWRILDELRIPLNAPLGFAVLAGTVAFGLGTLDSPGVVVGTAALMLAFDRRDRALLAMATVFLLTFGALYYYSLELTLLQKSGVLAASGLLLLGIRSRIKEPQIP